MGQAPSRPVSPAPTGTDEPRRVRIIQPLGPTQAAAAADQRAGSVEVGGELDQGVGFVVQRFEHL